MFNTESYHKRKKISTRYIFHAFAQIKAKWQN